MMSPAADDRLRDEVRQLGGLLGEVIRDEGGQALFDHVEAVRQASIAYHRDPTSHPAGRLGKLLTAMALDQAAGVAHSGAISRGTITVPVPIGPPRLTPSASHTTSHAIRTRATG